MLNSFLRYGWASSPGRRSEEHTSELQSLITISYAVFCLKKKNEDRQSVRSGPEKITRVCRRWPPDPDAGGEGPPLRVFRSGGHGRCSLDRTLHPRWVSLR